MHQVNARWSIRWSHWTGNRFFKEWLMSKLIGHKRQFSCHFRCGTSMLRFMLCWKVRLLWRVLHSRSTAREAAFRFWEFLEADLNEIEWWIWELPWTPIPNGSFSMRLMLADVSYVWWLRNWIPRSANFGLQLLTCCRTSCPNWCSMQSWNLPERVVPQRKFEVKWSIWWTSLGKKYPLWYNSKLQIYCQHAFWCRTCPLRPATARVWAQTSTKLHRSLWLQVPCYTIVLETGGWGRLGLSLPTWEIKQ